MMHQTWVEISDWITYMSKVYGGTVTDIEGRTWDWGQALCRVIYGVNWNTDPEFERDNMKAPEEPAPTMAINLVKKWNTGEWPKEIVEPEKVNEAP